MTVVDRDCLKHVIAVVGQVIAAGKQHRLFGEEMDGWLTIIQQENGIFNGSPIGRVQSRIVTEEYRTLVQEQVYQLWRAPAVLTSSACEQKGAPWAVAIRAHDFVLGYASKGDWSLNEAVLVVAAIRLRQFHPIDVLNRQCGLFSNKWIGSLLESTIGIG